MRKINIISILLDHFNTLSDDRTDKISISDIITFYVFPFILGAAFANAKASIKPEAIAALIAVFAVFAALLFSAQIAVYSITPSEKKSSADRISEEVEGKRISDERKFFSEINSNISYVILISAISLFSFCAMMVFESYGSISKFLVGFLSIHFIFNLLMLIKRLHITLSLKYQD